MGKALIGIVIGSRADFNIMRRGLESLRVMGVPYWLEFASPHKAPHRVAQFAQSAAANGLQVIICAAGGSAQIAGMLACHTNLPIIAVPIDSTPLRGQDSLVSMVQQPPGVPVATVGINAGENAALLATQILALKFPAFRVVLNHTRSNMAQRMDTSRKELLSAYPDLTEPARTAPAHSRHGESDRDTDPDSTPGVDSEGATPEPTPEEEITPPENPEKESRGTIEPGAYLSEHSSASKPYNHAGKFITTPIPQEPGTATDYPELRQEISQGAPDLSDEPYPAPPANADLTPLPIALQSFPSFQDQPSGDQAGRAAPQFDYSEVENPELADTDENFSSSDHHPLTVKTQTFKINHGNPDEDTLSHAMMVLLEGGIVAFPTDTVYGLAVDALSPDAVRRLYEIKGQSAEQKSLSVLIHSPDLLETLVKEVPPSVERVLETYWPGGLSVLFAKNPNILESVSQAPSIAIRIPNDPIPLALLKLIGRPLAVINAAVENRPAAVNAQEVLERFENRIDCVLDAGPCRGGETSTVLSVIGEPFEILRQGAIPNRDLKKLLGQNVRE